MMTTGRDSDAPGSRPPRRARIVHGLTLRSAFQPVISLNHCKPVGHEALLRATNAAGASVPPGQALRFLEAKVGAEAVDVMCRELHVGSYVTSLLPGWLFLNVSPRLVQNVPTIIESYRAFLASSSLPAYRVVIEIVETSSYDERALAKTVRSFRDLGCLVAIDDFGAGHSNFERIWRIRPDIVKVDRTMIEQAAREPVVRRVLPGLVSLLHEAECLVVIEGIENEDQALVAMESDADFVQGFYFAEPAETQHDPELIRFRLDTLAQKFRRLVAAKMDRDRTSIDQYCSAFLGCAEKVRAGVKLGYASMHLLEMAGVERVYLLDSEGLQVERNVESGRSLGSNDRRFDPCADVTGANWFRRSYFRKAIRQPGVVQVSRPYLSVRDGKSCVTLSLAFGEGAAMRVLCADVDWASGSALSDEMGSGRFRTARPQPMPAQDSELA